MPKIAGDMNAGTVLLYTLFETLPSTHLTMLQIPREVVIIGPFGALTKLDLLG